MNKKLQGFLIFLSVAIILFGIFTPSLLLIVFVGYLLFYEGICLISGFFEWMESKKERYYEVTGTVKNLIGTHLRASLFIIFPLASITLIITDIQNYHTWKAILYPYTDFLTILNHTSNSAELNIGRFLFETTTRAFLIFNSLQIIHTSIVLERIIGVRFTKKYPPLTNIIYKIVKWAKECDETKIIDTAEIISFLEK